MVGLGDGVEVYGHVEGPAHADVVPGCDLVVKSEPRLRTKRKRGKLQLGIGLLQTQGLVDAGEVGVHPPPHKLRLPRAHQGQPGSRVKDHQELDLIGVGQTVVGELLVEAPIVIDLGVGPRAALHHVGELVGPRSGHVAPVLNVPELLDDLAGDDVGMRSNGYCLQGTERGRLQLEHDRRIVGSSD